MPAPAHTTKPTENPQAQFRKAVRGLRAPLTGVTAISCVGNILMLTGPLFMMLVYDKVLSSKSVPTLVALSVLALLLYCFYGFLEGLRGRLMTRVGITFDHRLAPTLFNATLKLPLHFGPHARNHDPLQDLATIRNFLMGAGPSAMLDLPWIPLYFAILYLIHPVLALGSVLRRAVPGGRSASSTRRSPAAAPARCSRCRSPPCPCWATPSATPRRPRP